MHDRFFMRVLERLRDLQRSSQHLLDRQGACLYSILQCFAVNIFEDEGEPASRFLEAVNRRNVWMIERREDLGFTPESCEPFVVLHKHVGKNFECDISPELGIAGSIDLSHSTGPERPDDS